MDKEGSIYLNVNQFLERFYYLLEQSAPEAGRLIQFLQKDYRATSRRDNGRLINEQDAKALADEKNWSFPSPEAQDLLARIIASLGDPSQEASNFLEMVYLLTVFHYNVISHKDYEASIRLQIFLIGEGRIEKPEISYKMLKAITKKYDIAPKSTEIYRMLAMHPLATPNDLRTYAKDVRAFSATTTKLEELRAMLSDQMVRVDEKIAAEQKKDFPSEATIKGFGIACFGDIAQIILDIVDSLVRSEHLSPTEIRPAERLVDQLRKKYDINTIMSSEHAYIQEYQQSLEMRVAEQQSEIQSQKATIEARDKEIERIRKLADEHSDTVAKQETQIAELQKENNRLKKDQETLIKTLQLKLAAIKVDLAEYDEKKNMTFGRGAALAKILEHLKEILYGQNPQQDYNLVKEIDLMFAKIKSEEMQGSQI